jgi:hypothetical protein
MKNLSIFIVLLLIFSCQNTMPLSQEMDEYCDCLNNPLVQMEKCIRLRDDIIKKYEFDPKASEIIQMKLSECAKN